MTSPISSASPHQINEKFIQAKNPDKIIQICGENLSRLNHVNISTAIHRFALLSKYSLLNPNQKSFLKRIANIASSNFEEMDCRHLSIIAWSYANVQMYNATFFNRLANEFLQKVENCSPQDLSNLLWSFATLNQKHESISPIVEECFKKIELFNHYDLAILLWSLATLNYMPHNSLLEKLTQEISKKIESLNVQDISLITWFYGKFKIKDETLFRAFTKIIPTMQLNPNVLCNIAWSYALLNIKDDLFFDFLAQTARKNRNLTQDEKIIITWSFCVVDHPQISSLLKLLNEIDFDNLLKKHKTQLKFIYLFCNSKPNLIFPGNKKLCLSIKQHNNGIIQNSKLQQDIASYLSQLNISFKKEALINGLSVDFLIINRKIVIEVDGRSHYMYNSHEPTGKSSFKHRLIEAAGYKLLVIPFWIWDAFHTNKEKCNYLNDLLS